MLMSRESCGHKLVEILVFPSPTNYMLRSSSFFNRFKERDSSKMIGNFPEVLKSNQFICNYTKYAIECHMVFYVIVVTFLVALLMNKFTSVVMDE